MSVLAKPDSIVSEAFRILRTNMAFMAKKGKPVQVITFTSFNEGAGKTFISSNLAMTLLYARKRVIVVDLDIRKGTLSTSFATHRGKGLTDYLVDPDMKPEDIIIRSEKGTQPDVITAGSSAESG